MTQTDTNLFIGKKVCKRSGKPFKSGHFYIGKKVCKRSGKPFKSGHKTNTVTGMTINPNTNKTAFTFAEDDSVVDTWICHVVPVKENSETS